MADVPTSPVLPPPDPALSALQDLPLPSPVPYTPQTAGWWIVAALLLLLLAWVVWRWYQHRQANRYRAEALQELEQIAQTLTQPNAAGQEAAARLAALVKRVALVSAPRQAIASLTGEAWLQWLDQTLPRAGFLDAPGRLLPQLAYGGAQGVEPQTLQALLALLRRWIKDHRVHL